jgi:hypothetical protein
MRVDRPPLITGRLDYHRIGPLRGELAAVFPDRLMASPVAAGHV